MIGADVFLWGTHIGSVSQKNAHSPAVFNYSQDFLASKIELSPLMMPLSNRIYSFPALPEESFHMLPGMLADSLPDRFGTNVFNYYLSRQGRDSNSMSSVEHLCFVGSRSMGALEYLPSWEPTANNETIDVDLLVSIASEILSERESMSEQMNEDGLKHIIQMGTSAGGARAKAIINWNQKTGEIKSGQLDLEEGFEPWIIKFDGVDNNKDHEEQADEKQYTRIEYAYYLMAEKAGLLMAPSRLLKKGNYYHFLTRRFDRVLDNQGNAMKLHMQTLGALAHLDFNQPGAYSYEQAAQICRKLGLSQESVEDIFRRACFNIIFNNNDDHVKNISFLMNKRGEWWLAPAYDVTFAYSPKSMWLSRHQMSLAGKQKAYSIEDIFLAASNMDISLRKARIIFEEVKHVALCWMECAEIASMQEKRALQIQEYFNLLSD